MAVSFLAHAKQQTAQMNGKNFAPPPGARDGVIRRVGPFARDGERRTDTGHIERAALQGSFRRFCAQRRRPHRAIGDPCAGNPTARERQLRGNAENGYPLRMIPRHFQEAERSGRWPLERHGRNKRRLPFASAEKLVNRHLALSEAAGKHYGSVECEQRRGEISVGTWREQVAADRGRLSYGRTT